MIKLNFNHLVKCFANWFFVCGMVFSAGTLFAQSKPEIDLTKCKEYVADYKWTKALECYQKAFEQDSTSEEVQLGLARVYSGMGFNENHYYAKSKALYEKILAKNHKSVGAYIGLGDMYMDMHIRDNQYNDAILNFKKAHVLDSNNAAIYVALGKAYDFGHQTNLSILNYEKAVSLNPRDTTTLWQLGLIYHSSGRYQEAYHSFQRWYVQDPEHHSLLISMARMALNNDNALAIECFQKYLATKNADPAVISDLADTYARTNDYVQAMKYYRMCAKNKQYGCNKGVVEMAIQLGLDAVADTFILPMIKIDYTSWPQDGYWQICRWYFEVPKTPNFQRTATFARKIIKLDPKTQHGYYYLAMAQAGRKEFDKALININTLLKIQTSTFLKLRDMEGKAHVFIMQRKYEEAILWLKKSILFNQESGLGGRSPEAHYKLGLIYAILHDSERSESHLSSAKGDDRFGKGYYLENDLWVVDFLKSEMK